MPKSQDNGRWHSISRLPKFHKTGFFKNWLPNITRSDFKFIAVLWSISFIDPWVQFWVSNSLSNSREPGNHVFTVTLIALFVFKLIFTLVVSIIADLRNHKFIIYVSSLFMYITGLIIGAIGAMVDYATLYNVPLWLTASIFITSPAKFCLIFNQRPSASITETREVVAVFEMAVSLTMLLLFAFTFFCGHNFSQSVSITVWIILVTLVVGLLVLTILAKRYKTEETIKETNILSVLNGIKLDVVKRPEDNSETIKMKIAYFQRFILFISLLVPILVITSVDAYLTTIDRFASSNVKDDSPNQMRKFVAKFVAIPAIGLLFSGAKGYFGRLGDILVIGAAHTFNTIVTLLIVLYFSTVDITVDTRRIVTVSSATEYIVISGHLPNSKQAVVRIFGAIDQKFIFKCSAWNNTVNIDTWVEFVVNVEDQPQILTMQIQMHEHSTPFTFISTNIQANKRYWFLLLGKGEKLTELRPVHGVIDYWTFDHTKLFLLNGIHEDVVPANTLKFEVLNMESTRRSIHDLPPKSMSSSIVLKAGLYKFSFHGASIVVYLKPYSEHAAVISDFQSPRFSVTIHRTLEIRPKQSPPFRPVTSDEKIMQASHVLNGLAQAAVTVGYIHFFWMESPVRLRTTLFACFQVTNEIVAAATRELLGEFGLNEAFIYLVMSFAAGIYHVSVGTFYGIRFHRGPQRSNEENVLEETTNTALNISPSRSVTQKSEVDAVPSQSEQSPQKQSKKYLLF